MGEGQGGDDEALKFEGFLCSLALTFSPFIETLQIVIVF
jgi:hypothetical protein